MPIYSTHLCILLTTSFFVGSIVFFSTPLGLPMSPDSISYLKGAQGALDGVGLSFVSSEWPPLYPTLLIIFGSLTHGDVILGARILQSILLAITFLLVFLLIYRNFTCNFLFSLISAVSICIQPTLFKTYFYAWSDGLLVTLVLVDLLLLVALCNRTKKYRVYIFIALFVIAGLAFLTRFAGICVALLNATIYFLFSYWIPFAKRLFQSAFQLFLPILMFIPWLSHQGISNSPATQREVSFHPITTDSASFGLNTIRNWFLPITVTETHSIINFIFIFLGFVPIFWIFSIIFLCLIDLWKKRWSLPNDTGYFQPFQLSLAVFFSIYLIFLVAAISFVDDKVVLDNRILAPAYTCLSLLFIGILFCTRHLWIKFSLSVIFAFTLFSTYSNLRAWLLINYYNGVELSDKNFKSKSVFQFAKTCSREIIVYADNPWHFDLIFKSKVMWLPRRILFNTGRTNVQYEAEVQSLHLKAGLIIVEERDSEIALKIDTNGAFKKIYDAPDGLIWENVQIRAGTCAR